MTGILEARLPEAQEQAVPHRRWITTAAAMAACLILIFSGLFLNNRPYASVYLSINPEVRIDVNRRDVVVGLEGMNDDGAALLTDYSYKKKDLNLVMEELTDRAINMRYLHAGGKITVTLDADEAWSIHHSDTIRTSLKEHLSDRLSVTIEVTGQYVPQPPQNTSPGESLVIPVEIPTEPPKPSAPKPSGSVSSGGDSDYGDSSYEHPAPDPKPAPAPTPAPSYGSGDSDYGGSGYGES